MTARRLAAILAADVVGYSRMMGEDEEGTARSVRESRAGAAATIAAHGGRLFKTMGDGFVVEFSSVVSAVECALALQTEAARLNEGVAEGKRLRYQPLGAALNRAARRPRRRADSPCPQAPVFPPARSLPPEFPFRRRRVRR